MKFDTFIPDTLGGSTTILGESGTPIEYAPINDNFIIISLFVCVALTVIYWKRARGFLSYQLFNIFSTPREGSSVLRETEHQKKYLKYFPLQLAFLTALMAYSLFAGGAHISLPLPSWIVIPLYSIIVLIIIFAMEFIHDFINSLYFETRERRLYHTERITFLTYYGVIILPFAIAGVLIGQYVAFVCEALFFALFIVKIIEISKHYSIFFQKNGRFLHFFLYLCTLEAVPILLTVDILTLITLFMSRGVMS